MTSINCVFDEIVTINLKKIKGSNLRIFLQV